MWFRFWLELTLYLDPDFMWTICISWTIVQARSLGSTAREEELAGGMAKFLLNKYVAMLQLAKQDFLKGEQETFNKYTWVLLRFWWLNIVYSSSILPVSMVFFLL